MSSSSATVAAALLLAASPAFADVSGQIASGGPGHVFALDAETGHPLHWQTRQPIRSFDQLSGRLNDPNATDEQKAAARERERAFEQRAKSSLLAVALHTTADVDGRFTFADLEPGRYRFVALAWLGLEAMPGAIRPGEPQPEASHTIILGAGETGEPPLSEAFATLQPLGDRSLAVATSPAEVEGLLLISSGRLRHFPLAPHAAGPEFWRGLLCATITPGRRETITIHGLPGDRPLDLLHFNNDNAGGVGFARLTIDELEAARATVPIYAVWSDGHHEPPPRLRPLVDLLLAGSAVIADETGDAAARLQALSRTVAEATGDPPPEAATPDGIAALYSRTFTFEDQTYTLGDYAAARQLFRLRQTHESRRRFRDQNGRPEN